MDGFASGRIQLTGISGGDDGDLNIADLASPPNFGSADIGSGDGTSGGDSGGIAPVRKRRGRKPGSGGGSRSKASSPASVEAVTRALAIVHAGLAKATKTPELELDDDDADALAKATCNVLDQFDIKPDPKIEALIAFGITASTIYGSKMYLIQERKKQEKKVEKERAAQAQLYGQ